MSPLTCLQVRALMDQRAQGLSDADRLRVESHTVGCATCADHSAVLSSLVALAQSAPSTLSESARQRVIARALSQPIAPATESASSLLWPRWTLAGGAVVVLGVLFLFLRPTDAVVPVARPSSASAAVTSTVAESEPGLTLQRFETHAPRRVSVDGAALELSANTAVEWDAVAARVTLQRGTVRAVVASRAGKAPFSVRTPDFDVMVVGTDFEVTLQGVMVHEGVVRVQDHEGRPLHEALRAGEAWSRETVAATPALDEGSTRTPGNASGKSAVSVPSVHAAVQWIAEARTLLASGDVARARRELERAERAPLSMAQRLEVLTLMAETYQVAGMNGRAIAHYDRVGKLDATSSAADNADFAAARLTLSSGDRVGAKERFARYLQVHPAGRFRVEVERVLTTLRNSSQATTRSEP